MVKVGHDAAEPVSIAKLGICAVVAVAICIVIQVVCNKLGIR